MIILVSLIAFVLPLLLRRFLLVLQLLMAFLWIILLINMPNTFPASDFENTMHRILFITLPMWVFGSLVALSISSKRVERNICEQSPNLKIPTIDYETSKADENECPICFSKLEETQKKCTNCGYVFNDRI